MLKLYNSLGREKQEFKPIDQDQVRIYTCGPTVYSKVHIGNLRSYVFSDILRRSLTYLGYSVLQGMNITDVGHLTSDADAGEDKMQKSAEKENKHPLEIARIYTDFFMEEIQKLNIIKAEKIETATNTIKNQIEIIKLLEEKGYIYQDELAIYFDTSKLKDYGKLSGQALNEKEVGSRQEVVIDKNKKNPQDFVLWFFLTGHNKNHVLYWPSPWGEGFPGWHIECSAISRKLLGQPFDIHTGGVDHIGTHHTNEIAQSEAGFGSPLANYWLHGEFLQIDNGKIGKSLGNSVLLSDIEKEGFTPLDFRYLMLQAHYRSQLNFAFANLASARTARLKLQAFVFGQLSKDGQRGGQILEKYNQKFIEFLEDDLAIPQALALAWEMIKDNTVSDEDKIKTLLKFDEVFGLNLESEIEISIPEQVQKLAQERQVAREKKDFEASDRLREQIKALGYDVKDKADGSQEIKKET